MLLRQVQTEVQTGPGPAPGQAMEVETLGPICDVFPTFFTYGQTQRAPLPLHTAAHITGGVRRMLRR